MVKMTTLTMGGVTHEIVDEAARADIENLKKNLKVMNSITNSIEDSVVRADNVSLVEHEVTTKINCPTNVEPTTITVQRFGKNLLKPSGGNYSRNGLTFTNNGDGSFTIKGTATASTSFQLTNLASNPIYLHEGVTYTQSVVIIKGDGSGVTIVPNVEDSDGNVEWNYFNNNQTKTAEMYYKVRGYEAYVENGKTVDLTFKVQLEVGNAATNYEEYIDTTSYTPSPDGTVNGIMSLSPTMTLLTDTDGVTMKCEYNVDTKAYIDQKFEELKALIQ